MLRLAPCGRRFDGRSDVKCDAAYSCCQRCGYSSGDGQEVVKTATYTERPASAAARARSHVEPDPGGTGKGEDAPLLSACQARPPGTSWGLPAASFLLARGRRPGSRSAKVRLIASFLPTAERACARRSPLDPRMVPGHPVLQKRSTPDQR